MPLAGGWCSVWIYFGFVFAWTKGARPRFDTSTDMGLVLVPADAEVDSVIFRLRATDQDADFPLVFEITATITPVVRIDNLPCTLYNKVCQANVILTKRLIPGRLHDFAVRVRDTKGDSNSMQATISVTNATTPRDKIFPHIPSLIMVPEDTKPGKELDYLLVRANSWSGKPVYIELWQPKELFTIRQRQTPTQTRGIITLIGELDFETQSMYTLTMYATDPYTEPGKDTRNIAGLNLVVVVQDVQDVPPIFTLAPPLTRLNNSVQPGDIILRVHAEDGDKGVPREITYGLVSEGNPFTPFFNISETTGEIVLARPLEELTQITHVGAPVVLTVVAEEIRRSREEPPAQATVVEVGFLLGEPGNSPPYFESDNYVVTIDENLEPGTAITFGEQYSTRIRDEDIGKAGVFALKLENNNGTFEIIPTVAERTAEFVITVRDNTLIDYELYKTLSFKIVAQEVGPATNLSASATVTVYLRDVNDNPPVFDEESYEVTLSENVTAGTRVTQVHATDKDTGILGSIKYTSITGQGSEAFTMDPDTGLITVSMGSSLDREIAPRLLLSVEARDEDGKGNRGVVPLIVNLLDVNDNAPLFEKDVYEFTLNSDLTNFTSPAIIKAIDADAEPPNNEVRYELIHGNYENKFYLDEITGELILRSPITKIRRKKQSAFESFARKGGKEFIKGQDVPRELTLKETNSSNVTSSKTDHNKTYTPSENIEIVNSRSKRANNDSLYTLTARAYDLGVPHLSSVTQIRVLSGAAMEARIVMFVVPGEHPDSTKTAETLATITGGRVTVLETRPYVPQNQSGTGNTLPGGGKKSIVIARVEQTEPGTPLVDVEKIRETLAANGVGIIGGTDGVTNMMPTVSETKPSNDGVIHTGDGQTTNVNNTITTIHNEEVTVYKAENKLLFWLLIILGLLMLLAIAALIICCICPGCPFYMAPRKRRVHSSETLVVRADGRPKRHLHRKPAAVVDATWNGRKQAWSADPTRRNWQFNRRNTKNCGLASLPGDVAYISGQTNDVQVNIESLRVRDGPVYDPSRRSRIDEQERMYMEDVEAQKVREYEAAELDSLQRHEMERGSDIPRQGYRQRYMEPDMNEETTVREQHFYREGNAEVLRLVTRGQVEDTSVSHRHHPTTLVVDGKDIILRRFIEDQKSRHDLSMQDLEAARSMESHQRSKEMPQQQPEIILIPERLDLGHRQHVDELGPNVQRLVIDHGDYDVQKIESKESQMRDASHRQERQERQEGMVHGASTSTEKPSVVTKDYVQTSNVQSYSFHDLELARQNALLTRLLLERENRHVPGGVHDSTSYLETQSLPGQVAIATQTDRTAATQTDRHVRSRSDNDESDEDSRQKKKSKSKKRYGDGDWKRTRTLWMKSPIEEEDGPCFDKRLSILRKKVREVKEGRKISLEPEVLREISDSLDGNGSSYPAEEEETYQRSTEQTSIRYKILNETENGSGSSTEVCKDKYEKSFGEKTHEDLTDAKMDATESTSSPEIRARHEKHVKGKADDKSPKKDGKSKTRKADGSGKPSFKILEREITLLTKKLSKLGDKKQPEHTGSDSTSQDKSASTSKTFKSDSDQKSSKKVDTSGSQSQKHSAGPAAVTSKTQVEQSQRKDPSVVKTRQKLKYQQAQVISTGSSEYDDTFDKPRKQSSGFVQEVVKQKQQAGKLKRQAQVERRELKKQSAQSQDQDSEKRTEGSSKGTPKTETKSERSGRTSRAPKLAVVSRRENVEEQSTGTSSDRPEGKKATSARRDPEKKSNTESSENGSNDSNPRKPQEIPKQVSEVIKDDFVERSGRQDTEKPMTADLDAKEGKMGRETNESVSGTNGESKVTKEKLVDERTTVEKPKERDEQVTLKEIVEDVMIVEDMTKERGNESISDVTRETVSKLTETSPNGDKKHEQAPASTKSESASIVHSKKDETKEKVKDKGFDESKDEKRFSMKSVTREMGSIIEGTLGKFENKADSLADNVKDASKVIDEKIEKVTEKSESLNGKVKDLEEKVEGALLKTEKKIVEIKNDGIKETQEIVHEVQQDTKSTDSLSGSKTNLVEKEHFAPIAQAIENIIKIGESLTDNKVDSTEKESSVDTSTDEQKEKDQFEEQKIQGAFDVSETDVTRQPDETVEKHEDIEPSGNVTEDTKQTMMDESTKQTREDEFLTEAVESDEQSTKSPVSIERVNGKEGITPKAVEADPNFQSDTLKNGKEIVTPNFEEEKDTKLSPRSSDVSEGHLTVPLEKNLPSISDNIDKKEVLEADERSDEKVETQIVQQDEEENGREEFQDKNTEDEGKAFTDNKMEATMKETIKEDMKSDALTDDKVPVSEEKELDTFLGSETSEKETHNETASPVITESPGGGKSDEISDKKNAVDSAVKLKKKEVQQKEPDQISDSEAMVSLEKQDDSKAVGEAKNDKTADSRRRESEDSKKSDEILDDKFAESIEKEKEDSKESNKISDDESLKLIQEDSSNNKGADVLLNIETTESNKVEPTESKEKDIGKIPSDESSQYPGDETRESKESDKPADEKSTTSIKKGSVEIEEPEQASDNKSTESIKAESTESAKPDKISNEETALSVKKESDEIADQKSMLSVERESGIKIEPDIKTTEKILKEEIPLSVEQKSKENKNSKETLSENLTSPTEKESEQSQEPEQLQREKPAVQAEKGLEQSEDPEKITSEKSTLSVEKESEESQKPHKISSEKPSSPKEQELEKGEKFDKILSEKSSLSMERQSEESTRSDQISGEKPSSSTKEKLREDEKSDEITSEKSSSSPKEVLEKSEKSDEITSGKRSSSAKKELEESEKSDETSSEKTPLPTAEQSEEREEPHKISDDKVLTPVEKKSEEIQKPDKNSDEKTVPPPDKELKEEKPPTTSSDNTHEEMERDSGKSDKHDEISDDKTPDPRAMELQGIPKSDELSDDKSVLPVEKQVEGGEEVKAVSEKMAGSPDDKGKTSPDGILEESRSSVGVGSDETTASELIGTRSNEGKEEPRATGIKTSDDFPETESPESSAVASKTSAEEKSKLDAIISHGPLEAAEASEPEDQLKLEDKQIESQGADKFVEDQTAVSKEDKSQPSARRQLTEARSLTESFRDESSKHDEMLNLEEKFEAEEDKGDGAEGERYADVSLPLFSSIIESTDESDESDSSSDISRKTTLTTRPYQTPRHRPRKSLEGESTETVEKAEAKSTDSDEQTFELDFVEDKNDETSKDENVHKDKDDDSSEKVSTVESVETMERKDDTNTDGIDGIKVSDDAVSHLQVPVAVANVLIGAAAANVQKQKSTDSKSSTEHETESPKSTKTKEQKAKADTKENKRQSKGVKDASSTTPQAQETKSDSTKVTERKAKQSDKPKPLPRKTKKSSPEETPEEKPTPQSKPRISRNRSQKQPSDQPKPKDPEPSKPPRKPEDQQRPKPPVSRRRSEREKKTSSSEKSSSPPKTGEIDTSKAQPKYMAWYKKNREEMERRRSELQAATDEEQLPRWLRRSLRTRKSDKSDKKKLDQKTPEVTPRTRRKVKPLVNVESEQLKAIVRQGRKLRKAEGGQNEDPPVQIFASTPPAPPQVDANHHLVQHSEYKYEKMPPPFYLHPPPAPHPSPQLSPQHFDSQQTMERRHAEEDLDSGIAISLQGGSRLRHQQLLEKKSVFDIAYNEAAPSQLRADSTTPPT